MSSSPATTPTCGSNSRTLGAGVRRVLTSRAESLPFRASWCRSLFGGPRSRLAPCVATRCGRTILLKRSHDANIVLVDLSKLVGDRLAISWEDFSPGP